MNDTRIALTPSMRERLALGHDQKGSVVSNWDLAALAPAGALRSTVNDMLKYLAATMNPKSRPMGATLATTHIKRHDAGSPNLNLGLAWHILTTPFGGDIVWHNGGTGGYRTFTGFDPVRHVGVVVLTNSQIGADDIGFHLVEPRMPLTPPAPPSAE